MAFFILGMGLMTGATLMALSEDEREAYYRNRNISMVYLGNKDGCDVYRDTLTGQFYVDDGWDVSRFGTAGFVPHPIDRERLKQLCTKYNRLNLPWMDFLLATFEGRESELWTSFFEKYELGPKPDEPTWGKGIRKARWADYDRQLDEWENNRKTLLPKFLEECKEWDRKRRSYDEQYRAQVSVSAGGQLLRRALSGGVTVMQSPPSAGSYKATVPAGSKPGDSFLVYAGGKTISVTVPPGVGPGQEILFQAPPTIQPLPMAVAVPANTVATPVTASTAPAAVRINPPSTPASLSNPLATSLPKKSSMNW